MMQLQKNEVQSTPYEIDIKNWVTKSNQLIEATYKLTLQEQRILLILSSKVQPNDEELKAYKFRVQDFMDIIGMKPGTGYYSHIKEVVTALQTKTLTIKQGSKTMVANWLITSMYEDNEGSVILKFNPDLKHLFLNLKEKFTSYQLENVIKLHSLYSIRIYELLKQYTNIGKRHFTIEELREYLGIETSKYKQYGHFKSKVINVALEELKLKTDLSFTFEEHKTGRKVTSLTFYIINHKNTLVKKIDPNKVPIEYKESEHYKGLLELGIDEEKVKYLINTYKKEQIQRNIEYVRSRKTPIDNVGGYLFNAIKKDFASSNVKQAPTRSSRFTSDYNQEEQLELLQDEKLDKLQSYMKRYADTSAFEAHCLEVKKIKDRLSQMSKENRDVAYDSLVEMMKSDIEMLSKSDRGIRETHEFKDDYIKEIYESLLQD
ncbi:replication initiation protein [Sutcliffiella horikoshii]|uniref:replication initiation protein n=1 Tax=Sutcliffiella horikoshii TaxID=79883 RepID=UPI00203D0CAB|nr:replication initiation protein [Sutcliffiella horikoshii]